MGISQTVLARLLDVDLSPLLLVNALRLHGQPNQLPALLEAVVRLSRAAPVIGWREVIAFEACPGDRLNLPPFQTVAAWRVFEPEPGC